MSAPDEITRITDYWARCSPFVLAQYARSTRLLGVMEAGCKQSDDSEATLFQIKAAFLLATAVGEQLDFLGNLYREQRLGRTDADYRAAVQVKAALAVNGTIEEILAFLYATFPTMSDAEYYPEYPAGFAILTDNTADGIGMMRYLSPAGVNGVFGEPIYDSDGNRLVDSDGNYVYSARL